MKSKRNYGILLLVIGIVLYLFANYISGQVNAGKGKVAASQSILDQSKSLFGGSPAGEMATGSAQSKINEGKGQISAYEKLAICLHVGGAILFVVGGGLIVLSFRGKKGR